MAGYSGTPLSKKLGIQHSSGVAFHNLPKDVSSDLEESLSGCTVLHKPADNLDFIMLFTPEGDQSIKLLPAYSKRLPPTGMVWVSWHRMVLSVNT